MRKQTKIVVIHSKELVFAGICAALIAFLIVLIFVVFGAEKKEDEPAKSTSSPYVAGVYKSSIMLNQTPIDVTVTLDSDHINSIEFVNLNDSITTMYPLLMPSLENIASQVCESQSTDNITYPAESQFTSTLLLDAIKQSLKKAAV